MMVEFASGSRDYNKGGDFLIISNYEEIDDNYKFIIEESLIKG